MKSNQLTFKFILVGDSKGGKRQFCDNLLKESAVKMGWQTCKNYQLGKLSIKVQLWDTAGQQRYRSLMRTYCKGASVCLLCFSCDNRQSFDNLQNQLRLIQQNTGSKIKIYLVGCNSDRMQEVFPGEGLNFALNHSIGYISASSNDIEGTNQSFRCIVQELVVEYINQLDIKQLHLKQLDPKVLKDLPLIPKP